jgi:hypothetical protein
MDFLRSREDLVGYMLPRGPTASLDAVAFSPGEWLMPRSWTNDLDTPPALTLYFALTPKGKVHHHCSAGTPARGAPPGRSP